MMFRFVLLASAVGVMAFAQTPPVKERVKAVRNLAKQGTSAVEPLKTYMKDPEGEVRAEAVEALTAVGTQHSLDPLVGATRDNDPRVQQLASEGLVNFYLPGYVKRGFSRMSSTVRSQIDKENSDVVPPFVQVRPDVIAALGAVASGGSSMQSRAAAARAVGVLRGRQAVPALLTALKSKDDAVMYESLIALQKIRDVTGGPGVVFLLRDLNERVRSTAMETAGLLQAREAIPVLQKMFSENPPIRVKRSIVTALAMLPDASSRPVFTTALADKDEKVRTAALEGFARLKSQQDHALVKQSFESEKKNSARLAAAFAMVSLGNRDLGEFAPLPYLANSLNVRSLETAAEMYLKELAREPQVRAALHSRAQPDAVKAEKIGIARVLADGGGPDSVVVLERLSKDADTDVAQEALNALRVLRTRLFDGKQ